jgi:3-oxoadipate enol-lactonase
MPRAPVNGIELYYESTGQGTPLVLLMGFGDDCHAWSNQLPAFAGSHRTIVLNHRGVGASDKPADGYSIPQFAADALGLLDHLGIERAHVLGYSMGGRVAQHLAAHHPGRLHGLVLAATASKPNPLNLYSLKAGAYLYERFGPEAAAAFGPLISFTHSFFAANLPSLLAAIGRPVATAMPVHAYLGHVRAIQEHDTTGVLGRITAPTLILIGEHEWLNPMPEAERLRAGIPNARIEVIPGGGHGFLWETPEAFNRAVLAFLEEVESPR